MENHLDGLPGFGVALSGSPKIPVLENRSGRTVIAYVLNATDLNGRGAVHQMLLTLSVQPAGIPDGGSIYVHGNAPVNLTGRKHGTWQSKHSTWQSRSIGQGPTVSATLQSVIFADGQFVGVDEYGAFESFAERIKVIAEVGLLGKAGAWDQVEALAKALTQLSLRPPRGEDSTLYFDQRAAAERLAQERKQKGDAAANKLAEIYSSLPTLWK